MASRPRKPVWTSVRAAVLPALATLIVAFFGGYALFGSNGVLAWGDYSHKLDARRTDLIKIERDKAVLANRVALLDPRHANPDMVDELVRRDLGVARPDEVIVPLK
jgi:cell division protein FtsB